jgi:hypothetical protein
MIFFRDLFKHTTNEMLNRLLRFFAIISSLVRNSFQEVNRREDTLDPDTNIFIAASFSIIKKGFVILNTVPTISKVLQNNVVRDLLSHNSCSSYSCIRIRGLLLGFSTDALALSTVISWTVPALKGCCRCLTVLFRRLLKETQLAAPHCQGGLPRCAIVRLQHFLPASYTHQLMRRPFMCRSAVVAICTSDGDRLHLLLMDH